MVDACDDGPGRPKPSEDQGRETRASNGQSRRGCDGGWMMDGAAAKRVIDQGQDRGDCSGWRLAFVCLFLEYLY